MLQNIRIVLVETSHTGNMGSVARAMKTMGLTNLWLVNPLVKPDSQAIALAAGASDVIGNAHIVDTLDEALAGCSLVVGTSARSRTLPWPMLDPRECAIVPASLEQELLAKDIFVINIQNVKMVKNLTFG
ncbi:TrmH family RNA methyltransferase, partial [Escherichia coli]|uniref:TrmH family RNA methyltransferase n=1 Tax=Escherichia coli TaxID=562 RepID=UPI0027E50DC7